MNSDDLDRLITGALRAQAEQIRPEQLSPANAPASPPRRGPRWGWSVPLLAAAAVLALAVGTSVVVNQAQSHRMTPGTSISPAAPSPRGSGSSSSRSSSGSSSSTTAASAAPAPTTSAPRPGVVPNRSAPRPDPSSSMITTPVAKSGLPAPYQPLWPFKDLAAVAAWQSASRMTGSQPWHLDAAQTALSFTQGYLGFTELDRVNGVRYEGTSQAHVSVGYLDPNGVAHTAAVLHLLRFGSSPQSPWEVVGSDDTTFSLERPAYGSQVSSPVVVSGHITGVDESIRVWIRQNTPASGGTVLASIPAGGEHAAWSSPGLAFDQRGVLTIVAATGGHLQAVERFAIQGVHT